MSMKNSNDTLGNRTRNLPVCGAVPQPTAPPRALLLNCTLFLNFSLPCFMLKLLELLPGISDIFLSSVLDILTKMSLLRNAHQLQNFICTDDGAFTKDDASLHQIFHLQLCCFYIQYLVLSVVQLHSAE